jgi:serine/threonine-protein kinase
LVGNAPPLFRIIHGNFVSLSVGTRFGPYQIIAKIGEGGMGEVYRATDTNLKRAVALKVLPASVATDPDRLARFQREAEVLALLNHPNIAQIYGLEKADGVTALVMELVEGTTLADRIARGPIPVDEALAIAKQIAQALEAAHEESIIHRDLKPANIKLRADATVKLLDFGLAKALEPTSSAGTAGTASPTITSPAMMTGLGVLLGTAPYMSPEQAQGKPVDRRADIWAFGCVFYEMLTGRRAFEAENVSLTLSKVLQSDPAFDALPADVPARVRQTVRLCLRKPLRERIPDLGAVRLLLEGAFEPVAEATEAAAVAQSAWRRAVPLLLTAIGAAVFGGIIVWRLIPDLGPGSQLVMRFALPSSTSIAPRGPGTGRHVLAVSPQGTHLVYWADNQLYLRALDRLDEAIAMRGTEDAREPFFSPDGHWIGFHQNGQLRRVSVDGGAPLALGDAQNPWGISWDTDGFIRYGQGSRGIWQVPATGGTAAQLIAVAKGEQAHGPQLLPDGKWILFTIRPATVDSWDQAHIVAQSVESGERITLIERGRDARYVPTGHLVYGLNGNLLGVPFDVRKRRVTGAAVPLVEGVLDADVRTGAMHFSVSKDGTLVYLAGASTGRSTLTWINRDGRQVRLPADALPYSMPRVSPDGTRVAVEILGRDGVDIHVYDLARQALTQLTSSPSQGRYPLWTPDSRHVVFYSDLAGGGLYSKAADGTGTLKRLTTTRAVQVPYSWSADGRTLLLEQRAGDLVGQGDIFMLSLASEAIATPLVQTAADESEPAVSPDGRWLAYTSIEAGGRPDVFVRPFPNVDDGRWQISTSGGRFSPLWSSGGFSPLWSRDGSQLFFISVGRAFSVPVKTEPTFRPGTPAVMFELPQFYRGRSVRRQWDIARDGRFLVVNAGDGAATGEPSQTRMVVVLNWFEELKRLVSTK